MGLKILHTADWHLDSPFTGFTGKQREQLKQEQKKIPGKISDLCRREQCDLVLLAGDIFDGPATRETVDLVKRSLKACGVPVLVAVAFGGGFLVWLVLRRVPVVNTYLI